MRNETSSSFQEWRNDLGDSHFLWDEFVSDFYREEWEKLSSNEKAICMNYEKQLKRDEAPSIKLIKVINEICEKYPDFHFGCLPVEKMPSPVINFQTTDFSGYLPEAKA